MAGWHDDAKNAARGRHRRPRVLIAGMTAWAALAIYYSDCALSRSGSDLPAAPALGTLGAFLFLPDRRRRTLFGFGAAFAIVLLVVSIQPSNERDWQPEVAVLLYATQDGDLVTLHNVRDFDYRTQQDFVPRYDDRTFDLRKLDAVDLIAVYWAGDAIAHIMVSFGFAGDHVAFSIETRKEKGEAYSSIAGFFKRYELIYVVGDERDLIRVRTNYRRPEEQVYLYRRARPGSARRLFLEYVDKINQLKERPSSTYAHDQLHDRRVVAGPAPHGPAAASTGGAAERLFSGTRLRARQPRH